MVHLEGTSTHLECFLKVNKFVIQIIQTIKMLTKIVIVASSVMGRALLIRDL